MKSYFILQHKLQKRKFHDIGISPMLGIILLALGFVFLTEFLYSKSHFTSYFLLIIALSLCLKLSERNRSEFLQLNFGHVLFFKIRIIENAMIGLPFLLVLLIHHSFLQAIILLISLILLAFHQRTFLNLWTHPTPFYAKPFEFSVGFRSTSWLILASYLLLSVAIYVSNFNLGIFSISLIYGVCISYFLKLEDTFFVWIFAQTPAQFLRSKIVVGMVYSSILVFPASFTMSCFFSSKIVLIIGFTGIGMVFLIPVILVKYAVFPSQLTIGEIILLVSSVFFPPLLLIVIPFYYYKSIQNLTSILV